MHVRRSITVGWALSLTLTFGCKTGPQTGAIQGDVYLVMQSGDVKRVAGNTVRLLADSASVRRSVAGACSTFARDGHALSEHYELLIKQFNQALNRSDVDQADRFRVASEHVLDSLPALRLRTRSSIDSALLRATVAEAPTGVNAHYSFPTLKPGRYILWASTTIGDKNYTWWAPIVVGAGDSLKKDLDNSSEADASVHCPPLAKLETP